MLVRSANDTKTKGVSLAVYYVGGSLGGMGICGRKSYRRMAMLLTSTQRRERMKKETNSKGTHDCFLWREMGIKRQGYCMECGRKIPFYGLRLWLMRFLR